MPPFMNASAYRRTLRRAPSRKRIMSRLVSAIRTSMQMIRMRRTDSKRWAKRTKCCPTPSCARATTARGRRRSRAKPQTSTRAPFSRCSLGTSASPLTSAASPSRRSPSARAPSPRRRCACSRSAVRFALRSSSRLACSRTWRARRRLSALRWRRTQPRSPRLLSAGHSSPPSGSRTPTKRSSSSQILWWGLGTLPQPFRKARGPGSSSKGTRSSPRRTRSGRLSRLSVRFAASRQKRSSSRSSSRSSKKKRGERARAGLESRRRQRIRRRSRRHRRSLLGFLRRISRRRSRPWWRLCGRRA
mmetsp:Transcript_15180/g.49808  ORF Transcript_15180/g.49808 Transcript_15180/m.49808 type:complete len:302 (+) Transcript_15180:525-1430(+)